jgi:hypothetical protein
LGTTSPCCDVVYYSSKVGLYIRVFIFFNFFKNSEKVKNDKTDYYHLNMDRIVVPSSIGDPYLPPPLWPHRPPVPWPHAPIELSWGGAASAVAWGQGGIRGGMGAGRRPTTSTLGAMVERRRRLRGCGAEAATTWGSGRGGTGPAVALSLMAIRSTSPTQHYRKGIGPGLGWHCGLMVRHRPARKRLRATSGRAALLDIYNFF